MTETPSATCPRCHGPLTQGACTRCLLSAALDFEEEEPLATRRFGDYEIGEKIARGGMGVVYRARQLSLKRPVAIKMILGGELASEEEVQRFRLEAETAGRLRHPNIVSVYDVGECDHENYIAMELITGGSLSQHRFSDAKTIAMLMAKVARALAFAHEHGVLHRDLKPSNILMDHLGEPRLTDFGLAKIINQERSGSFTNSMLGSPSYMAPEQAMRAEVTTATDVYGLGAVLYDLLSGGPPFHGDTAVETLRRLVDKAPAPLPLAVPRDLATICLKCLEKTPVARYPSARELADDLERFVRGEVIHARPVPPIEHVVRWARRRPAFATLAATTVLLFIIGVSGIFWQWRKAEQATVEQTKALKHLHWLEIGRWISDGDTSRALAYLARELRERPGNWKAAMYAMSIIDQHAFPKNVGPEIIPGVKLTQSACLSPDGTWAAAAGEDKAIHVWKVATGAEWARLPLSSPVTALAVGRGSSALAVATDDGGLLTYASINAEPVRLPRTNAAPVLALDLSSDGTHLMARCKDRVELHSPGAAPQSFVMDGGVNGAAMARDGSRILAWNKKNATVWDTVHPGELLRLTAKVNFSHGAIAGNGSRICLVEDKYLARCWEVSPQVELSAVTSAMTTFTLVTMNEPGTRFTLAGVGDDILIFDAVSGLQVSPTMRHSYQVQSLVLSAEGGRLVSRSVDDIVRVWDAESGQSLMSPLWMGLSNRNASLDLSRDGRTILIHDKSTGFYPSSGSKFSKASIDQEWREKLAVWQGTRTRPPDRRTVEGMLDFCGCRISPDGKLGVLGLGPALSCYVYELATGRVVLDKPLPGDLYVELFSPDGTRLYAMTANGWLYGWSLETGEELWEPHQQPGKVRPGALSADGTRIIAGHNDGHIRVYDTSTGEQVMALDHPGEIKTLRFAPGSSNLFISGGTDQFAHTWDLQSGQMLQTFTGHGDTIISSAWSPDGKYVATASYDATARVWNATTGALACKPLVHFTWLSHLEFSPDGKKLLTACRDGTARLWDPLTGEPLGDPIRQGQTCEAVRFTADGAAFIVRDHSGFQFYDSELGEPVTQHYSAPVCSGLGIDSECWRAIINRDGTEVFLGTAMTEGDFWNIEQPRGPSPPWFPDLLEALALMRFDEYGAIALVKGSQLEPVRQAILKSNPADPSVRWARRVLDLPPDHLR